MLNVVNDAPGTVKSQREETRKILTLNFPYRMATIKILLSLSGWYVDYIVLADTVSCCQ